MPTDAVDLILFSCAAAVVSPAPALSPSWGAVAFAVLLVLLTSLLLGVVALVLLPSHASPNSLAIAHR